MNILWYIPHSTNVLLNSTQIGLVKLKRRSLKRSFYVPEFRLFVKKSVLSVCELSNFSLVWQFIAKFSFALIDRITDYLTIKCLQDYKDLFTNFMDKTIIIFGGDLSGEEEVDKEAMRWES